MCRPSRPAATCRALAIAIAAASMAATTGASAQERPLVFRGARIIPIAGAPIERGVLVVQGGKIVAVGPVDAVRAPSGAQVHDVSGKVIMPGLVDTHSHIGEGDGGDRSAPIQGDVRILDAVNPRADGLQQAQAGGITTVNVMPGSGHLMSGQTVYLKLRDGRTIEDLLVCADPEREVCGGLKMANGTNPRGNPPWPGTRAKAAALVREKFVQAVEYRAKLREAERDSTKRPARDLELETLVQVLDGTRVVHHHTHRHDDILTVLRLQREFGFRLVLQHAIEGWKVAEEIARAGVPASIIVIDAPGGKLEASEARFETAAILDRAGVAVAFHTDDGITDSRWFLRSAALAVRAGMPRERALQALTSVPARMLDLDRRIGTLEPGKDADFIVLSGDPLSVYTHVEQTWVEGTRVFDRSDPKDRAYAVGGFKVSTDRVVDHHAGMEDH
ncbi:MAG TPA: amidohydrolase family protein [Gemmatimonadales bacterium]|nr:amidohydrolase family protein [Gemmatimonadales bacterium]